MSTIRTHVQTEQYDFSDFSFQSTVYEDLLAFLSRNITVTNDPATLSVSLLDIMKKLTIISISASARYFLLICKQYLSTRGDLLHCMLVQ